MAESRELSLVIENPAQGQFLKRIDWNRDEFMQLVQSAMERYKGVTFTEDQVKEAKEERARLNALKKAISDRRIQVKNEVMAPYTRFESEVKEVVALIDGPIAEIDRQIKAYEDSQKEGKKEALLQYFVETAADLDGILTFERVFDRRYLNVSITLAKAKKDIADKVERIRADLRTIESIEDEYRIIVKDAYLRTFDMSQAMGEMYRMKDLKRQEEERRAAADREAAARRAQGNVTAQPGNTPSIVGKNPAVQNAHPETEPRRPVSAPSADGQGSLPSAQDPFINPPKPKRYKASFTVTGTMDEILSVKQFLVDNGIKFEKGVK